jgi:hypothetical protein
MLFIQSFGSNQHSRLFLLVSRRQLSRKISHRELHIHYDEIVFPLLEKVEQKLLGSMHEQLPSLISRFAYQSLRLSVASLISRFAYQSLRLSVAHSELFAPLFLKVDLAPPFPKVDLKN